MKIAILSIIFVILLIGLFFCSYGCFGNKYEEMPDLKGKTENKLKRY